MVKRLFPAIVIVALLAAGCGGDDDKALDAAAKNAATEGDAGQGKDGAAEGGTDAKTPGGTDDKDGTGSATPTTAGGPPATNADGSPATTTTRAPFPVELKLEKKCVKRGSNGDTQALIAKTRPGDTVAYSTEYSDHSNELSNPSYKSGSGYGEADGKGNFRSEWKVPDNAPSGTARLHVIADNRIHPPLEFKVVGPLESC